MSGKGKARNNQKAERGKQLTIRVSKEWHKRFKRACLDSESTCQEIAVELLSSWLRQQTALAPRAE
jgi:hypothetical protein